MTNPHLPSDTKKPLRCAIYTRKSHEEGLEQDFNSLDAQRESAEAYIRSQQHEGWQVVDTLYDDGGFTGGNTKRPALIRLLDDIAYGAIDVVIVYKVDRLSRSLADFSKLIELFDEHDVSFVSVTQQFNTSTSMGRLTLNVLLSFAQFEREVTGERIRDKIAASKQKGMWMGGSPPMGYAVDDHKLVVIENEANLVRKLYRRYAKSAIEDGQASLLALSAQFTDEGFTTKQWVSQTGKQHGGKPLTPKHLYRMLTNPIYIGKIKHKDKVYEGQHNAIIEQDLWDQVQQAIASQESKATRKHSPFLLQGRLRHHQGYAMSPSTSQKKIRAEVGDGYIKHIRYYVSQKAIKHGYGNCSLKSVNAIQIEQLVMAVLDRQIQERCDGGNSGHGVDKQAFGFFAAWSEHKQHRHYRALLSKVTLAPDKMVVEVDQAKLDELCVSLKAKSLENESGHVEPSSASKSAAASRPTLHYQPDVQASANRLLITVNVQIKRIDGRRFILDENGNDLVLSQGKLDPIIIDALKKAYQWKQAFEQEPKLKAVKLAVQLGISSQVMLRRITLITLAPAIQKQILTGALPPRINLKQLIEVSRILAWNNQMKFLQLTG